MQALNFTVFIKNSILFPVFGNEFNNLDNGRHRWTHPVCPSAAQAT